MNKIMLRAVKTGYLLCALSFFGCMGSCSDSKEEALFLEVQPEETKEQTSMRLISYNILEGMKLDKAGNYDKFVKWVKDKDPDILALQEANKFTQQSLEELAKRFNHPYVVTNIKTDDNYPVALTSKHPIEVVRKLTKNVSHGAIHARIKGVNLVILHLWPMSYGDKEGVYPDGDAYRLGETKLFLDSTLRKYPEQPKWLVMGDFNAVSPLDKNDLAGGANRNYVVHEHILSSNLKDALRQNYNYFIRSCPTVYGGWVPNGSNGSRIDFIYGTQPVLRDMTHAEMIMDDFTDNYSDHYPMMIEFRN
ncbi:MAG: endonuclease/exonuclease/phosphatase family protein [Bacteroidales bacterium]